MGFDALTSRTEVATLGGGCFWCTEAVFSELRGVASVEPGYSGGNVANPTYGQVCSDTTGHAEVSQVSFDPNSLSFRDLLKVFFYTHDPTTPNKQGADEGSQYRSVIFYHSEEQRRVAQEVINELANEKAFKGPIVTELVQFVSFYPAEDYHHEYYRRNPRQSYCQVVISPKLSKLRSHFQSMLKTSTFAQ